MIFWVLVFDVLVVFSVCLELRLLGLLFGFDDFGFLVGLMWFV